MREPLTKLEKKRVEEAEAIVKREIDALDPIGLFPGAPEDEYKREIREISFRVSDANGNWMKLAEIIYIVFAYSFDVPMAGNMNRYVAAATNIIQKIKKKRSEVADDMEKKYSVLYPMLYRRYKRTVMSHPEGTVTHDADCEIYNSFFRICTCGLHHELLTIDHDDVMKIYPKHYEEWDGKILVEVLLQIKEEKGLWTVCDECEGSGIDEDNLENCPACEGQGLVPFEMPEPIPDEEAKKIFGDIFGKKDDNEEIPEN
jgi:hypothetical protein